MSRTTLTSSYFKIAILLSVLASLLVPATFAHALTISPARIEISGDPGKTVRGKYILINEQNVEKTFYSTFENFEAQGETGSPNFVQADEGLATWINSADIVTLQPNESVELDFSITIPNDAEPGGHFAAIFWGTTDPNQPEGQEQVTIGAKIGVLILLRVNGDIKEGGGIDGFTPLDEKKWYSSVPVDLEYRFTNDGGDRVKPEGTVTIKNMLGITTSVIDANPQKGNVLPDSTRKYALHWNGVSDNDENPDDRLSDPQNILERLKYQVTHFAFGVYFANLEVEYGVQETFTDSKSTMFVVIPWELLILVIIVIVGLRYAFKSYNAMIIRKAQSMQRPAQPTPADTETSLDDEQQ